jgi:hypothetical protein
MAELLAELGTLLGMAGVAERRLLFGQECLLLLRVMQRVARSTAQLGARVGGFGEGAVFVFSRVTRQAAMVDVVDRGSLEREDL